MHQAALAVCLAAFAAEAHAQTPEPCGKRPRTIGGAVGYVQQYLELESSYGTSVPRHTVAVDSGVEFAGRADFPLVGPLRVRGEGAFSRMPVHEGDATIGTMWERRLTGFITTNFGSRIRTSSLCGHVAFGGGLYAMSFRNTTLRRPGWAIGFGMEGPVGPGVLQIDGTLHLITIGRDAPLVNMSASPTVTLLFGWAIRF